MELESESDSSPTHTKSLSPLFVLSQFYNSQKTEAFAIFCLSEYETTNLYFITEKLQLYFFFLMTNLMSI